jgi:hypothetical protein
MHQDGAESPSSGVRTEFYRRTLAHTAARSDQEWSDPQLRRHRPHQAAGEPFLFNRKTRSDLGWAFTGLVDGGRITEYANDGSDITRIYRHQLAACTYEVLPGPGKQLRWSVPANRGHDDLLISTALTARLDEIDWRDRTTRGAEATERSDARRRR